MRVLSVTNVNQAYPRGLALLRDHGRRAPSRYGDVVELEDPVATVYARPRERILFNAARDANPFFHLFESLWMLAGQNDVAWLARFNPRMTEFSDDGRTFHGAYGHRWREHFHSADRGTCDQITALARLLSEDRMTRRAVLQIWDASADLGAPSKDLPCNIAVTFSGRFDRLDMTVMNRSNDVIWGAYGANVVQFSMLQEVLAGLVGLPVGRYTQISNNYHAYTDKFGPLCDAEDRRGHPIEDPYAAGTCEPHALFTPGLVADTWLGDLDRFVGWAAFEKIPAEPSYRHQWFRTVATPLYRAWVAWKARDFLEALLCAHGVEASDWRLAAVLYLQRRQVHALAADTERAARRDPAAGEAAI